VRILVDVVTIIYFYLWSADGCFDDLYSIHCHSLFLHTPFVELIYAFII